MLSLSPLLHVSSKPALSQKLKVHIPQTLLIRKGKENHSNKPIEVQKVTAEICDIIAPEDSDDEGDESPTTASPTIGDVVVATTSCVVTSTILANASATSSAAPEEFTGAAGSVQVTAGMLFGAGAAVAAAIL